MTISLETRKYIKSDSKFQCCTDSEDNHSRLLPIEDPDRVQQIITNMIIKSGGIVTIMILVVGAISLSTRHVVYTAAPIIVEYVIIETIESLRP